VRPAPCTHTHAHTHAHAHSQVTVSRQVSHAARYHQEENRPRLRSQPPVSQQAQQPARQSSSSKSLTPHHASQHDSTPHKPLPANAHYHKQQVSATRPTKPLSGPHLELQLPALPFSIHRLPQANGSPVTQLARPVAKLVAAVALAVAAGLGQRRVACSGVGGWGVAQGKERVCSSPGRDVLQRQAGCWPTTAARTGKLRQNTGKTANPLHRHPTTHCHPTNQSKHSRPPTAEHQRKLGAQSLGRVQARQASHCFAGGQRDWLGACGAGGHPAVDGAAHLQGGQRGWVVMVGGLDVRAAQSGLESSVKQPTYTYTSAIHSMRARPSTQQAKAGGSSQGTELVACLARHIRF
jgi:hypothetical protein